MENSTNTTAQQQRQPTEISSNNRSSDVIITTINSRDVHSTTISDNYVVAFMTTTSISSRYDKNSVDVTSNSAHDVIAGAGDGNSSDAIVVSTRRPPPTMTSWCLTESPCLNNGTCRRVAAAASAAAATEVGAGVDDSDIWRCHCPSGTAGLRCELVIQSSMSACEETGPCVHGICVNDGTGYRCYCVPGELSRRPVVSSSIIETPSFRALRSTNLLKFAFETKEK